MRRLSTKATRQKKIDLGKFIKRNSRFVLFEVHRVIRMQLKCEASEAEKLIEEAIRLDYFLEAGTVGLYPGIQVYQLNPEKEPILTL